MPGCFNPAGVLTLTVCLGSQEGQPGPQFKSCVQSLAQQYKKVIKPLQDIPKKDNKYSEGSRRELTEVTWLVHSREEETEGGPNCSLEVSHEGKQRGRHCFLQ